MNYLFDTNHWSFLQRGDPRVVSRVSALPPDARIYMSVIVQAELLTGIELIGGTSRELELRKAYEAALRQSARILPIDADIVPRFASLYAYLRRTGQPIGVNDMWIGATALAHSLTLVTSDPDFDRIPDLMIDNWLIS